VDGVVHLGAADPARPVDARDVFAALQPAIAGRATTLVAAVAPRRRAVGAVTGVPGLMRAVARELPRHHVRAVEVAADQSPGVVARLLADEVLDPAGPASVAYVDGTRTTRRVAKGTPLGAEPPKLPFDADSVVVLTGGARGITARTAVALARATGCRLELLGRSPRPADEDPRTASAPDRPALRRALISTGEMRAPSEVEAACDRIMAARDIRATLHTLSEIGVPTTYHPVDVRDGEAFGRVLDEIRSRQGRIDAVVHGAGVLDDRLARDKTHAGFDRVFATKVDAARHLLAHLADDVRLVVFFGSVSGVFGNRGQVDYSAANDALDELAARFDGVDERRVISIDWGPWADTGMVSPELEREYARRGVGLIDPDEGVRALLAEMATLPGEPAQVVVMRAEPEALDGRPPIAPGTWTPLGAEVAVDDEPEPGDGVVSGPGRTEHLTGHITLEDLTERG
jgi:NAD(P)-dependent dehydrogenase (short-subunit alcohol dehydrogenase family)